MDLKMIVGVRATDALIRTSQRQKIHCCNSRWDKLRKEKIEMEFRGTNFNK